MEIESVHKYLALNKQANGNIEVMFAGQPCLTVSEMNMWTINPVFAKLVYGANIFEDIPQCLEESITSEEAIAAGILKLYELGAFRTEVDFPEDTYAATMDAVVEEATKSAVNASKNIFEAFSKRNDLIECAKCLFQLYENDRSEYTANIDMGDSGNKQTSKVKKFKLKNNMGETLSTHATEGDALAQFKNLGSTKGVKIVAEDNEDEAYEKWETAVKEAHPNKVLKFKGRVEKGVHTTSAEVSGEDRSYGVWDHSQNTGNVFTPKEEEIEDNGVQTALRKHKPLALKKAYA